MLKSKNKTAKLRVDDDIVKGELIAGEKLIWSARTSILGGVMLLSLFFLPILAFHGIALLLKVSDASSHLGIFYLFGCGVVAFGTSKLREKLYVVTDQRILILNARTGEKIEAHSRDVAVPLYRSDFFGTSTIGWKLPDMISNGVNQPTPNAVSFLGVSSSDVDALKIKFPSGKTAFAQSDFAPSGARSDLGARGAGPSHSLGQVGGSRKGPIYLLICVGLLCLSLYLGQQQTEFLKRAEHITGTVNGHGYSGKDKFSTVEFEYGGKTYGRYLQASGRLEEGDDVPILMEPKNPTGAVVDRPSMYYANAVLVGTVSLMFGILSLFRIRDFKFRR